MEQIRGIQRALAQTQLLELPHCGHSQQRDQPERLVAATCNFLNQGQRDVAR